MSNELAGRVAIITGGARGIGLAIAQDLDRHGAQIVIIDSGVAIGGAPESPEIAHTAAATLRAGLGIAADIAGPGVAAHAVQTAIERFGGVDLIVNNAAIIRDGFIFKTSTDAWEATLRTNLTGAYHLLAAATPTMREQAKSGRAAGSIVNIVSTAGIYGNFGQSAYAAAKGGLLALTRVVAHDLARSKIICNAIAPFGATRVTASIQPANDAQATYKAKALKVSPDYIARLVTYLATPAAQAVSGQIFGVRGRELFLFSQARPKIKVTVPTNGHDLADMVGVMKSFAPDFTDLVTDLEAFSADPLI